MKIRSVFLSCLLGVSLSSFAESLKSEDYETQRFKINSRIRDRLGSMLARGSRFRLERETLRALDSSVKFGIFTKSKIEQADAKDLEKNWRRYHRRLDLLHYEDWLSIWQIGDYAPLSPELDELYQRLLKEIGVGRMREERLTDIWVFNYSIPIVFNLYQYTPAVIDDQEYSYHFVPFLGAVSYWAARLYCEDQGIDSDRCKQIAEYVRWGIEAEIAPEISPLFYPVFYAK